MKTITCIDCNQTFSGETAEEIMEDMMMHYLSDHKDLLDVTTEELPDGWFVEFNQRFDLASDY
jgi:predicted small metal-binding protein